MRFPDLILQAPDELAIVQQVEILRLENEYLQAVVQHRASLEVDPELRAGLQRMTADRDRVAERLAVVDRQLENTRIRCTDLEDHTRRMRVELDRLEGSAAKVRTLTEDLSAARQQLQSLAEDNDRLTDRMTLLADAERDLVNLIKRLGSSPVGVILRRHRGFRRLTQRWLPCD